MKKVRLALLAVLLLSAAAARAHHAGGKLVVHDPWVRESLPGKTMSAGFLTFANDGEADALVGASCDCAAAVEMHRMVEAGGMMKMEQVPEIAIPSHAEVKLAPGGLHLMFFGVKTPLQAGQNVQLTLTFKSAPPQTLEVPVRALEGKK